MNPARRVASALALTAVLALGTACGSGSGSATEVSGSAAPAPSTAATSSAPSDAQLKAVFCAQAPALLRKVDTEIAGVKSSPQTAPQVLAEAVDQLDGLQPPAGVAPQWHRFVGAVSGLRDLVGKLDLDNPQANTRYAGELEALRPGLVEGGSAIDDWGKANC